ncbi:ribosome biogenesis GTP-binding protein YihA/YsxC [Pseudoramibacter sp.]|jgi:GTP-binding protein|uniref:ribosome biogenesis GTP-binding protein YihA/YsxC n=1 Tax=Pseudoramibacter sp. TaxID=2034862 RepID=UPI0025EA12DD|nr:ribosome biogenesis GTP-binding protein YihA/YsxC [Pseudoramibacter sp.]MCH4072763.1 ribosome biogenesis GTP-binding protein YihA/YsxC [Pseudoramibacter sp.]MCH4106534.1 ribosome biogenesis GTP-binding protein YihA/YsxC [Pseudoramibacter sp.]
MKINKAEIIISAVSEAQYPKDALPEIVLLGRSNVGKSSLINTLINRQHLARTSSRPGKTQTMNFYQINDQFRFVDMPGYGYAKVSRKEQEKWGEMIENYLLNRDNLRIVFLLVDSRHEPTEDDKLMYNWLKYYHLPTQIILTKFDKLSASRKKRAIKQLINILSIEPKYVLPFSSVTKDGFDACWQIIQDSISHE